MVQASFSQPVADDVAAGSIAVTEVHLDEQEIADVAAVLRSGRLREGKLCCEFEEAFAQKVGAKYAVSVSSGTAALHVTYCALLQPGDEVLVPSFTFVATASMVQVVGARPVFCEVDGRTLTMDADDARRRVTPRTRAVAPVHLFGNPCDIDEIRAFSSEYNLKIIWDAAQAHGARYHGLDIGRFDDAVCYSFYPSKNMTTAEGGMITTNDEALYRKMKLLRSHGQSGKYYHTLLGFNYRLTDVMAALGLRQLEKLDAWIGRRRANAVYLSSHLSSCPGISPPQEQAGAESSYSSYTILVDANRSGISRDELAQRLGACRIGSAVNYPLCLHQQPIFAELAASCRLPVAERLTAEVLTLPVHPFLNDVQLKAVVRAVKEAVGRA